MKRFKIGIGSPVYEEVYQYSKKATKKVVKDECRKYFILRFTARLFDKEQITEVLEHVYSGLASLSGCTEVINLDSMEWGEGSCFEEDNLVFKGAYCIPKNFDNVKEQRAAIEAKCKEFERVLGEKLCPIMTCPEPAPDDYYMWEE